jgi:hypothetical protein
VRVPAYVLEKPELITLDKIASEKNAEVRRVMIEKFGPSRYCRDAGAELIDADERASIGGGPRALMRLKTGERYLVGTDGSTSRVYWMPVDNDVSTCRDAHQQIAGVRDETLIRMEG